MLRKLYAHEFRALYKRLFPVYIGLAVITLMTRASYFIDTEKSGFMLGSIIKGSAVTLSILGIGAMAVISSVIIILRFYKNLLGNEGYLTFSLPVTPLNHIWCKLITAFVGTVTTIIVALGAIVALLIGNGWFTEMYTALKEGLCAICKTFGAAKSAVLLSQIVILAIVSVAMGLLMVYVSMSFGQRFKKRVGGSILTFAVIYIIMQAVETAIAILAIAFSGSITRLVTENVFLAATVGLSLCIVYELILATTFFIITHYMLTKKLNLE